MKDYRMIYLKITFKLCLDVKKLYFNKTLLDTTKCLQCKEWKLKGMKVVGCSL